MLNAQTIDTTSGGAFKLEGGTLAIRLYDLGGGLFAPNLGDTFDVLRADSIVGGFDFFDFDSPGNGLRWELSFISNLAGDDVLRLEVTAVPLPAPLWLLAIGCAALATLRRREAR